MNLKKMPEESIENYYYRLYNYKNASRDLTWQDIADIANAELDENLSADAYRKRFRKFKQEKIDNMESNIDKSLLEELDEQLLDIRREKVKLTDERTQINSYYKRIFREDSIKEIASEVAQTINNNFRLPIYSPIDEDVYYKEDKAILCISDWHYGLEISNYWNKYSPEICKNRLTQLETNVISHCLDHNIHELFVVNLGDLISGRIHNTIRIQNRIDVITQIIEISELLAQFLVNLSKYFNINYFDTTDNHSRIEPIKENSLELETLSRITKWFLKERLKDNANIFINDNEFSNDIATFTVNEFNVVAVHGDKDKPSKVINNMTLMTKQHYDLALTAHLHHFSCDETNETLLICNGSVMGTDDFAEKLRLNSKPSQNLIIVSPRNVCEVLYRIILD